jgi:RecB family exonuclease
VGSPPVSLEDLARRSLEDAGLVVASPVAAQRQLRAVVGDCLAPSDVEGTTRAVASTVRELLRTGVDLEALAADGSPRVARLAQVSAGYRKALAAQGRVDPAEALWAAASRVSEPQLLFLYGYARLGLGEEEFLNAAAGDGSEVLLTGAEHPLLAENLDASERLARRGWLVERRSAAAETVGERLARTLLGDEPPGEGVSAHVYPHMDAEVRGVLAAVKQHLRAGVSPSDISIVARDDASYGPPLLAAAWEYGVPVRALYAVPLEATRIGAWLQLFFEAQLANFPYETTVRLLRHPLWTGLWGEPWSRARRRRPSGRTAWGEVGVDFAALALPSRASRGTYIQQLKALIGNELRRRARRWPAEIIAGQTLLAALGELAEPATAICTLEGFAAEIAEVLALLTAPAHPGRGGVELHTPLSLFGACYRHVYVLGMAEGILPAPLRDDPVLDFHERKRLAAAGFPLDDAAAAAQREALSFLAMLQTAAERITLSYPKLAGTQESLPSPYLAALRLEPTPNPLTTACSPEEVRRLGLRGDVGTVDPVLVSARLAWGVERRREGTGPPDEHDGMVGLPLDPFARTFSASQLTQLGQCPFRWFAGYVLRLAEPEEADDLLSGSLRGRLFHSALRHSAAGRGEAADLREQVLTCLREAFLEAEADIQLPPLPAWGPQREEMLERLARAVASAEFCYDGAQVVALEEEFTGEWHGLQVRGVVDRIDRVPDGLVFIDYKSGSQTPSGIPDSIGGLRLDIQLPLYMEAARQALFPEEAARDAYYYSLTHGKRLPAKHDPEAIREFVASVIERLRRGHFPVAPDSEQKVCAFCPFDLVCRRGPRLGRKEVQA